MADEEESQITDQETANTQVPVSEAAITESAVLAEVSQEPEEIYVDVSGAVVSPEYTVWMQAAGYFKL